MNKQLQEINILVYYIEIHVVMDITLIILINYDYSRNLHKN